MRQEIITDSFMPAFSDKIQKKLDQGWLVKAIHLSPMKESSFGWFWALMEKP